MYKFKLIFSFALCLLLVNDLSAREILGFAGKSHEAAKTGSSDCQAATAQTELNINNVRTTLLAGGDLWWDLNNARYEVPKVEPGSGEVSRHSIFAGALWIGGFDALGQLKVAAQTYRQSGNDFYPGPLDLAGEVCAEVCSQFDQFWKVTGEDISQFLLAYDEAGGSITENDVPESLLAWPGRGSDFFNEYHDFSLPDGKSLAPFWDANNDNEYNPLDGDYPVIDPTEEGVYADQMIWWVFNDKGNAHSETGGEAIGLEIRALAFGYATNDEVNNMTFYKYVIENNSSTDLDSTYFAQWVDPDLGEYQDDYVGCNVENSVGIVYNGDAFDDGLQGYGEEIPMLGVDFFQGPKKPIINDEGETEYVELGMSSFLFYNNDNTERGNPNTASDFYGYLSGSWKDGTPFTFGGTGYGGSELSPYMFPSDPSDQSEGAWSECSEGITPADRRFLQASGAFKLEPGVINDIIVGVVWVPDVQYPCPSFSPLLNADRKAQALFDSNFKLKDGPDAPNVTIRELDQQLVLSLWNAEGSNNFNEAYAESDAVLSSIGKADSLYKFQGYRVFQLKESNVSPSDYDNPDVAREIFTVDIADGVTRIINYEEDPEVGTIVPVVKVEGQDNGIKHTFLVTEDQFAPGDKRLVNHKRYYFSALAYSHNNYTPYDPSDPSADPSAQQIPYLAGRNNVKVYTAIPHSSAAQNGGTIVQSAYGDGPEITQVSGVGNGGLELELTDESVATILENGQIDQPVYKGGMGPVDIKIYDPTIIPNSKFRLTVYNNEYYSLPSTTLKGGTLERQDDGSLKYTAPSGLDGDFDQFIYEIINQDGEVDKGSVVLEVNNPSLADPQAFDDTRMIYPSNGSDWTINISVLDNDNVFSSPEIVDFTLPNTAATLTFNEANNTFEYAGVENTYGEDFFDYTMKESGKTSTARVYINIINPAESAELDAVDDVLAVESGGTVAPLNNDVNSVFDNDKRLSSGAYWILENLDNGRVYDSQTNIALPNEQAIGGWEKNISSDDYENDDPLGFTVSVAQTINASEGDANITSDLTYENVQVRWLAPIPDVDGDSPINWIRSGNFEDTNADPPNQLEDHKRFGDFYDSEGYYESIINGGVAPYCLTGDDGGVVDIVPDIIEFFTISPACSNCYSGFPPTNTLDQIGSVDIVLTADKSLWTKCIVIEMGRNAGKNLMRTDKSLDQNGNGVDGEIGRSWFPGYAINVETGERLNMMFSENSFIGSENGNDMLFNPTDVISPPGLNFFEVPSYRMGGEHFIYVMNSRYDEGAAYHELFSLQPGDTYNGQEMTSQAALYTGPVKEIYDEAMYVAPMILIPGFEFLSVEEGLIPTTTKMRVRMKKPYQESEVNEPLVYEFDMGKYSALTNVDSVAVSALDAIRVVPNPYYAFSSYETSKLDNRVKITNLPDRAIVNIFTLDGTLVRTLDLDARGTDTSVSNKSGSTENSLEWDLKNFKNIPVASGMYIFHVEAPELGEERTLKWFGVIRPVDLDTF